MDTLLSSQLGRYWWVVAARGALAIVFGILAFFWPGATLLALVLIFGAYIFVDGVVAMFCAFQFRHDRERWPMLLLEGILGIAAGFVSFLWPGITALAWLYLIAAWALITGVLEIGTAIRMRRVIHGEWLLILSGIVSIGLALAFVLYPRAGLLAWVWIIGTYAILFGVLLVGFSFRLRRLATPGTPGSTVRPAGA